MKRKPLRRKRPTPRVHKTVIRLEGKAMSSLRQQRYFLANGFCELRLPGCEVWAGENTRGELSHVISRGAGGSDTLENVRWACRTCHQKSHNCDGKPVPAK